MTADLWIKVAVVYLFMAWLANRLRKQYEPGGIHRSMSLASSMASLGVAVYSTWAAVTLWAG